MGQSDQGVIQLVIKPFDISIIIQCFQLICEEFVIQISVKTDITVAAS